jgi:hypothetical protein
MSTFAHPIVVPGSSRLSRYVAAVCGLLHIGRIRMDIDNPGVTWDLQNLQGIQP